MRWTWLMVATLAAPGGAQQTVEFSGRSWAVTDRDAVVEEYLGREALRMRTGAAILQDTPFENGVIEYDMATTGHRSFAGVGFRFRQSPRVEYEHFYLRPHESGRFDATQYTPEIRGLSAWQLYPQYNAAQDIPTDQWIHVRLVVNGRHMEAWVGDATEPVQVVDDLRLGGAPGQVALTSNFPQAASLAVHPTAFSNFRITPGAASSDVADGASFDVAPGVVAEWALSEAVPGTPGQATALDADELDALSWDAVPTDPEGRVNIVEYRDFPEGAREGRVYASVVLRAEEARTVPLSFGFSDRGSVFLNGSLLFTGDNTYLSRSGRYLGVMTVDNDALYLPLAAGENELVFVVTESFGGWGLVARLGDVEGISVGAVRRGER